ncbi:MAG: nodulation protein NfeD [Chloroflexi bacterium]|nr:nodulation protein NfeD [Chloroflexota bacterium]
MWKKLVRPLWKWFAVALILATASYAVAWAQEDAGTALVLRLEGPLTPAMVQYLTRGLNTAQAEGDAVVVIELDTPGGSIDLMEQMVKAIRNSPVPVAVYVSPRGAIAGSAGTVITLAGHWALMAPETAIGAASPVGMQGEDLDKTLEAKTQEILQALVRSLAERRGPQAVQAAEATITEAKALSAQEALAVGLIDHIAPTLDDALAFLAGQHVTTSAGEVTLPAQLQPVFLRPTLGESLFHWLTNPNFVFLMLWLGAQALIVAFWHPSNWPAWFIGAAALLLAAYGLSILPVNWFGLGFMALAFVMFAVDVKATTHGALTAAGVVAFVFGALTLFNTPLALPQQRVSVPLVVGSGLVVAAASTFVVTMALRAQKQPVKTGLAQAHRLVGHVGYARTRLLPGRRGTVQVRGELWTAILPPGETPVETGQPVEIVEVQGVHLIVRPAQGEAKAAVVE